MTEDTNIQFGVGLDVDEKSFEKASKAIEQVSKEAALKKATKEAAQFARATGDVAEAQKRLAKVIAQRGDLTDAEAKRAIANVGKEINALEKLEAQEKKLARQQQARATEAASAGGRFDITRKKVELAGDFETQARTLGGAAGFAGFAGGEQLGAVAGELGAVTEALPLLKETIAGLPLAATGAATALGLTRAQLLAIGGVVAAVGVAFKLATDAANAQKKALEENAQRAKDINAEQRLTDTERRARIAELNEIISDETAAIESQAETANTTIDEVFTGLNAAVSTALLGNDLILGIDLYTDSQEKSAQIVQEATDAITDANDEIDRLSATLQEVASETTLEVASAAGERIRLEQEASKLSVEATQERLDAIKESRNVLEAELEVLRASGDESEEVTSRIAELEGGLNNLGVESGILGNQLSSGAAAARDAAEAQAKAAEEVAKAAEQAAEKITQARENLSRKLADIARNEQAALLKAAVANEKARNKLIADFAKAQVKQLNDVLKDQSALRGKAAEADLKAANKLSNDLEKIRAKGDADALKAIEARDFLAFAKTKETAQTEAQEAISQAEQERQERQRELQQSLDDRQTAFVEQRLEARAAFAERKKDLAQALKDQNASIANNAMQQRSAAQRAANQSIQDAQEALTKKLELERDYWRKSLALIPGAGGNGPTTNTSNTNINATFNNNVSGSTDAAALTDLILGVLQAGG
jgi:hypothetical protein